MARSTEDVARIEKHGRTISLTFKSYEGSTITFNQDTGASGPHAFGRLREVLNRVAPKA